VHVLASCLRSKVLVASLSILGTALFDVFLAHVLTPDDSVAATVHD
jgi:hypothetical protein